jgi:hypothetical protein
VDGRKYFHLPTWHIYQGDTRKEAISNFPAPYSRATPEPVQSYSGTDADSDSDAQGEADADAAPAAPSSPTPDYSAENQFSNPMPVRAERLYQQVTGQVSIPSDIAGEAIPNLIAVLDHYNGHDPGRAQREGKAIFARWCATVGKNRKQYSKTNPGWIGWWMEQIAPKPDEPAPAEEVPKPTAMCSEGYNLYQRARRDAKHLLGYEQHIKRCRVCGEAITSEQVLEKIHELTERMRSP